MEATDKIYELISVNLIEAGFEFSLNIIDNSYKHIGHIGYGKRGKSHFKVELVSDFFKNMNKVKRHQIIYGWLGDIVGREIHALEISVKTKSEL